MTIEVAHQPTIDLQSATPLSEDPRFSIPQYDRSRLQGGIVHIGVGGFHRAHLAAYVDELASAGDLDWSITGVGLLPGDAAMADALLSQNGHYTLVTRSPSGNEARIIGSIVDFVRHDGTAEGRAAIVDLLASPETRIVSLTITEGGYPVGVDGSFNPDAPTAGPDSAFAIIVDAMRIRRDNGQPPFTVMSCDNIIGNGSVARIATLGVAHAADPELGQWIADSGSFPNSMVDRITPVTTPADKAWVEATFGIRDTWPVMTEPFTQWALEDDFSCGRPAFENVGVIVTDDVEPYEVLKLRLLNAGHSTLAYLAALAGVEYVHDVMADDLLHRFFLGFVNNEAIPVLPDVPGINPAAYRDQLVERFSNPAIGDQVSRLCFDGSSKFPKFLLPTLRNQLDGEAVISLTALALAGWCRYLQGVDDQGQAIELAFDPLLAELTEAAAAAATDPAAFLQIASVFGDDLAADARFAEAFGQHLRSLSDVGVRSTLRTELA